MGKKIAVLAVQGRLSSMSARFRSWDANAWNCDKGPTFASLSTRFVLPGGESTVQAKLLREARHDRRAAPPHCGRHTRYGHMRGEPSSSRKPSRKVFPPQVTLPRKWSGSRRARSFRHAARDREEKCLRPAAGELPRESTVFRHRGRRPHDVYPGALHRRCPRGCDPARHGRWTHRRRESRQPARRSLPSRGSTTTCGFTSCS